MLTKACRPFLQDIESYAKLLASALKITASSGDGGCNACQQLLPRNTAKGHAAADRQVPTCRPAPDGAGRRAAAGIKAPQLAPSRCTSWFSSPRNSTRGRILYTYPSACTD